MPTPRARLSPAIVASGLAAVGIAGATLVFFLGSNTLEVDRGTIEAYGPRYAAHAERMSEALDRLVASRPGSTRFWALAAHLSATAQCAVPGPVPPVVEPLRTRCAEAAQAIRSVVSEAHQAPSPSFTSLVGAARTELDAVDDEIAELRCLARIECPDG